jgi:hypothetical protein
MTLNKVALLSVFLMAVSGCVDTGTRRYFGNRDQVVVNLRPETVTIQFYFTEDQYTADFPMEIVLSSHDTLQTRDKFQSNGFLIVGMVFIHYFLIDSVAITGGGETQWMYSDKYDPDFDKSCPNMYNARCWEFNDKDRVATYYIR